MHFYVLYFCSPQCEHESLPFLFIGALCRTDPTGRTSLFIRHFLFNAQFFPQTRPGKSTSVAIFSELSFISLFGCLLRSKNKLKATKKEKSTFSVQKKFKFCYCLPH